MRAVAAAAELGGQDPGDHGGLQNAKQIKHVETEVAAAHAQ